MHSYSARTQTPRLLRWSLMPIITFFLWATMVCPEVSKKPRNAGQNQRSISTSFTRRQMRSAQRQGMAQNSTAAL
ncbi:hypothetical protein ATCV1_z617L [Acanthocystis turfacea chlorella virus 1]|uniref:Uncharacterized protein z617L n=1 Tax=Chlorovirus heliozoae TaxID=322019 RepID=A7K9M7_9PHYC|nr:hypothetical protein ATCV1_z617L [Acanthocystis turfacea chlorella virus 1]ABT16751.1 hypothetical protein ATCV1_z617L [Acanthocystis turfacea chlorella virus 1]